MALFRSRKIEKKEESKAEQSPVIIARDVSSARAYAEVLRNPRVTEKATVHRELGVYVFDVAENATKRSIAAAVALLYKVSPRKVRIVPVPSKVKRSMRTGARGISRGGKKAYVYLKRGDSITLT